jgi:uncharacterized protein YkwD
MKFRTTSTRCPVGNLRALAVAALTLALAACGGGSGDSSAPSADTPPPVAVAPGTDNESPVDPALPIAPVPPDDTMAATSAWSGDCNVPNFVNDAVARVNAFRAQPRMCGETAYAAAPALVWNEKLAQAAHGHSLDMAVNNYFSHTSRDGRSLGQRISATGYAWSRIGENIAAGQGTMASVMGTWQGSKGHCANLMNPSFAHIGLSCAKGRAGAAFSPYWTMTLARPL